MKYYIKLYYKNSIVNYRKGGYTEEKEPEGLR